MSFLKTFWGSLTMLILVMIVLDRAGGFARVLGAGSGFVGNTVRAFKP